MIRQKKLIKQQLIDELTEQLLLDFPAESEIQRLMTALGLTYTLDPVDRMNAVLKLLYAHRLLDDAEAASELKL